MYPFMLRPRMFLDQAGGGGSSEDQADDTSTGDEKGKAKTEGSAEKTFSQEQVNKMMADARKQGREASLNQLLEKAGVKTTDELITSHAAYKKSEEEKLSEVEKAKKSADEAKAESNRLNHELRSLRFERDFDRTILKLDLDFQNDKARDVAFKLLDIEIAGKGDKEMEDAVKELVKEHAYLFTDTEPNEIDATKRGKPNPKTLIKELVESKRRSGRYQGI